MADATRKPAPYTEADLGLIKRIIPHRYPFLLIDRVRDIVPFEGAVGVKMVTNNEPHFTGHFPDAPIMPGVLIVEAMAQTSAVVVGISLDVVDKPLLTYFMGIDACKFRRMVVPGDVLELHCTVKRPGGKIWKFDGKAMVDGQVCAQAEFTAMMDLKTMADIHPSAVIEDGAQIGPGCRIGPFCVVGPQVRLGAGVVLKSHVVVTGNTVIGDETVVFPFACIGEVPQDLKFRGEDARLEIGSRNRIREYVTMNPGTEGGGGVTRIGDDGLYMAGSHVAHDCQIGNRVILVNNVAIAGHCVLEDDVIVGGLSGVHQFVRIGRGAMIGAVTMVTADVIPFGLVQGPRGHLDGLNLVGLKRRGATRTDITALRELLSGLGQGSFRDNARQMADGKVTAMQQEVLDFILGPSERSFLTPQRPA